METALLSIFALVIVLMFGFAAGALTIILWVVKSARSDYPESADSKAYAYAYEPFPEGPLQGASARPGASPDAATAAEPPPTQKTRLKPRCALCEAVKAAIRSPFRASVTK